MCVRVCIRSLLPSRETIHEIFQEGHNPYIMQCLWDIRKSMLKFKYWLWLSICVIWDEAITPSFILLPHNMGIWIQSIWHISVCPVESHRVQGIPIPHKQSDMHKDWGTTTGSTTHSIWGKNINKINLCTFMISAAGILYPYKLKCPPVHSPWELSRE